MSAGTGKSVAYYAVPTNRLCAGRLLKKLVTFRLDPDLLAKAKGKADLENRTLTNFVETVLKHAVDGHLPGDEHAAQTRPSHRPRPRGAHRTGASD